MTTRGGDGAVSEGARRRPVWLVATALAIAVSAVVLSLPFIVHWAWPGLDSGVLMVGNLFLGMILGLGAVIGFLHWKWDL